MTGRTHNVNLFGKMMRSRGVVVLASVLFLATWGSAEPFIFKKKKQSSGPRVIPIPCFVRTEYITSYVKDYKQVPVYVTQVVPKVKAEVVLKTVYTTRAVPLVVTQPKIVSVTRTANLNVATTEVKFLPQASIAYQPIGLSHTAHIPVTLTDTKVLTKTIRNTSYVTRLATSYTTNVVTTTRIKTQLSFSTTVIRTTQLLTKSVLSTKSLCLEDSFRRGVDSIISQGFGGLIGIYDAPGSGGDAGVYAGSYGNRLY